MRLHYTNQSCKDAAFTVAMADDLRELSNRIHRERARMIDDRFMAAICAVCGEMPTLEHLQAMGKVFIWPDGKMVLTWGSPDNVIASIPAPSLT
jgi:aconitase B